MRLIITTVILLLAYTKTSQANDVIDSLKNRPVTWYQLGIERLLRETRKWSSENRNILNVSIQTNESDNIQFYILPLNINYTSDQKIRSQCDEIANNFRHRVLNNFGDPTDQDVDGNNMYFLKWGRFFSPLGTSINQIEETGIGVSENAIITIITKLKPNTCVYMAGAKY